MTFQLQTLGNTNGPEPDTTCSACKWPDMHFAIQSMCEDVSMISTCSATLQADSCYCYTCSCLGIRPVEDKISLHCHSGGCGQTYQHDTQIPCQNASTALNFARLFVTHVWKNHGVAILPQTRTEFTNELIACAPLCELVGTCTRF